MRKLLSNPIFQASALIAAVAVAEGRAEAGTSVSISFNGATFTSGFNSYYPCGTIDRYGNARFYGVPYWRYHNYSNRSYYERYEYIDGSPYLFSDSSTLVELADRYDPGLRNPDWDPNAVPEEDRPIPDRVRDMIVKGEYADAASLVSVTTAGSAGADDAPLILMRGFALALAGDHEAAGAALRSAYELDPNLKQRAFDGDALVSANKLRAAVRDAQREASRAEAIGRPSQAVADRWFCLAFLQLAQGEYAKANESMRNAIDG